MTDIRKKLYILTVDFDEMSENGGILIKNGIAHGVDMIITPEHIKESNRPYIVQDVQGIECFFVDSEFYNKCEENDQWPQNLDGILQPEISSGTVSIEDIRTQSHDIADVDWAWFKDRMDDMAGIPPVRKPSATYSVSEVLNDNFANVPRVYICLDFDKMQDQKIALGEGGSYLPKSYFETDAPAIEITDGFFGYVFVNESHATPKNFEDLRRLGAQYIDADIYQRGLVIQPEQRPSIWSGLRDMFAHKGAKQTVHIHGDVEKSNISVDLGAMRVSVGKPVGGYPFMMQGDHARYLFWGNEETQSNRPWVKPCPVSSSVREEHVSSGTQKWVHTKISVQETQRLPMDQNDWNNVQHLRRSDASYGLVKDDKDAEPSLEL